jgi:ubiquinone/menaquinone biosynthesis C-methylase UbiE
MATTELDTYKQASRATWAAGDYAAISDAVTDPVAAVLVDHVGVTRGDEVLDVATGTGNVALVAAERGALAVGSDLTPELFDTAKRRAVDRGVDVDWVEADAEDLPFESGSFDSVLSTYGVQFAPRHDVAAKELLRVCRPGGAIGLANWTPESNVGEMFRIMGKYMPKPPAYVSPPPLWGSEQYVRGLFGGHDVSYETQTTPFRFGSAEHFMSFFETCYGPTVKAREKLTAAGRWDECRADLVEMMERRNAADDGTLHVDGEYALIVVKA